MNTSNIFIVFALTFHIQSLWAMDGNESGQENSSIGQFFASSFPYVLMPSAPTDMNFDRHYEDLLNAMKYEHQVQLFLLGLVHQICDLQPTHNEMFQPLSLRQQKYFCTIRRDDYQHVLEISKLQFSKDENDFSIF